MDRRQYIRQLIQSQRAQQPQISPRIARAYQRDVRRNQQARKIRQQALVRGDLETAFAPNLSEVYKYDK